VYAACASAADAKFDALCSELEVYANHLWGLGGQGAGATAGPLTRRRVHRGTSALVSLVPRGLLPEYRWPGIRSLSVAESDAHHSELWW
jgi:hypothetical protein